MIHNGEIEYLSVAEAKALFMAEGTDPLPDEPDPVVVLYGEPRTLACDNFNGHKLYAGAGIGCYLEVFNDNPDSFVRRGINVQFKAMPDFVRLTEGYTSGNGGMDEPVMCRPEPDYVADYFGSDKPDDGDKRQYWKKGTDPDRIYTPPVDPVTTPGKPTGPVVIPDTPVDNTPPVVNTKPDVVVDSDSVMTLSNRNFFTPVVEWKNGKARVTHPNRMDGPHLYILSGQPELSELPTTYDFSPGDEVVVDYQHANSSAEFWFWDLFRAQAIIHFGQPVLTTV